MKNTIISLKATDERLRRTNKSEYPEKGHNANNSCSPALVFKFAPHFVPR